MGRRPAGARDRGGRLRKGEGVVLMGHWLGGGVVPWAYRHPESADSAEAYQGAPGEGAHRRRRLADVRRLDRRSPGVPGDEDDSANAVEGAADGPLEYVAQGAIDANPLERAVNVRDCFQLGGLRVDARDSDPRRAARKRHRHGKHT